MTTPNPTTGATPTNPTLSPELQARAAATGGVSSSYVDPNDPDVLVTGPNTTKPKKGPVALDAEGKPLTGQYQDIVTPGQTKKKSVLLSELPAMNSAEYITLQKKMFAAGLYTGDIQEGDMRWGDQADEDTIKAYKLLLDRGAAYTTAKVGKPLAEVLDDAVAKKPATYGTAKRQPLTIGLTSPDDINKAVETVAGNVLGRRLSDAERERFVTLYHNLEISSQKSEYAAGAAGGTFTAAPSISGAVESAIKQQFPAEAKKMDATNTGNDFFNLLKGV